MHINITHRLSRNKEKIYYTLECGKHEGQRLSTGVFKFRKPKDQLQKNHIKEAQLILENKHSQMILNRQAINSGYVPKHKIKSNFIEYYEEYVRLNSPKGNRHLRQSFISFKKFIGKEYISPIDINETFCERFRSYLLANPIRMVRAASAAPIISSIFSLSSGLQRWLLARSSKLMT